MEVIDAILERFYKIEESIYEIAADTEDFDSARQSLKPDLDLLKRWADEIKSNKQSIYVIGKTSTGKSTFHNFLLDLHDGQALFKESTKTETSVLQTLQHVDSHDKAHVDIVIRDNDNLNLLALQWYRKNDQQAVLRLCTPEEISLLRDKIMVVDSVNGYNPEVAIEQINIYYPMRFFQGFTFVDTPGLGSHHIATDETVRSYIKARSHVFWLFNAGEAALSDDIKLIKEEYKITSDSEVLKRIVFIGNRFDLLNIEGGKKDKKNAQSENQTRSKKKLKECILDINGDFNIEMLNILFTSFKKPKKILGSETTFKIMEKLEAELLLSVNNREYDNIDSFVDTMIKVLEKMKNEIILNHEQKLKTEEEKNNLEKKCLKEDIENIKKRNNDFQKDLEKLIEKIKFDVTKKKGREYKKKVEEIDKEIEKMKKKIMNIHNSYTYENVEISDETYILFKKLNSFKIPDEAKVFGDKRRDLNNLFFFSKEFKAEKKKLKNSLKEFRSELHSYMDSLKNDFFSQERRLDEKISKLNEELRDKQRESTSLKSSKDSINKLIDQANKIYEELLKGLGQKIQQWKEPLVINEHTAIESFFELFHLTEKYSLVKKRGK